MARDSKQGNLQLTFIHQEIFIKKMSASNASNPAQMQIDIS
jgi:hypothetical protein